MKCRACGLLDFTIFAELQTAPPSNAYLTEEKLQHSEPWFPLRVLVCNHCFLCQTEDFVTAEDVFTNDYAYFSSVSKSWLEHSRDFAYKVSQVLELNKESLVIEVASNDGYLLQYFAEIGVPSLGIEPTRSTAEFANSRGIKTIVEFLSVETAEKIAKNHGKADLVVGNNVLAHVPDINDFVAGATILLKEDGTITFEFPHLVELIKHCQFDTIYHEHFSYLSLIALKPILNKQHLEIYDVEKITTHGGSLRVWLQLSATGKHNINPSVQKTLDEEVMFGLKNLRTYSNFQKRVLKLKNELLAFLIDAKLNDKLVAAYGAAAKGNTLINFAGIRNDLILFIVDNNPAKTGKFAPGSRIPILSVDYLEKLKPDYILILPWNLTDEIAPLLDHSQSWGCKTFIAVPKLRIL